MSERIYTRNKEQNQEVAQEHPAREAGKKAVESTVTVETDAMLDQIDEALEKNEELEDILDEIDDFLDEINAEEWVDSYVQCGGE